MTSIFFQTDSLCAFCCPHWYFSEFKTGNYFFLKIPLRFLFISCFMQTIGTEISSTVTISIIHAIYFSNAMCTVRYSHCVLMNNAGLGFLCNFSSEKFRFCLCSRTMPWFCFSNFRNLSLSKIASRIKLPLYLNWRCTK